MKKILLSALLVSLSALMFACSSGPKADPTTPKGLVEFSYEMLDEGKLEELSAYFDKSNMGAGSAEADQKLLLDVLSTRAAIIEKAGGLKQVEIVKEQLSQDGKVAEFEVIVHYNDGTNTTQRPYLELIDGKWMRTM